MVKEMGSGQTLLFGRFLGSLPSKGQEPHDAEEAKTGILGCCCPLENPLLSKKFKSKDPTK